MDFKQYLKKAKERYVENLKSIIVCRGIVEKVEPLLPEGWEIFIDSVCYGLYFRKDGNGKDVDVGEFKLICKLIEKATGEKLKRDASVSKKDNKINVLNAVMYYIKGRKITSGTCIGIHVHLFDPKNMPDCEITWKRKWTNEAIVSDACLGIGVDNGNN